MTTENNIVLTIEEIASNILEMENNNHGAKPTQISQNTIVFTKDEQKLDRQIRSTINRNLLYQRQVAYLQAMRQKRQLRRRRFGLKFK